MAADLEIVSSKIHVSLGLKADGALPAAPSDALGTITVGPNGFLNLLETQLGIPTSDVSFTARMIQYLACVEQTNHKNAFYHASYDADPFSVAKTLLQWRDHWYLAGWNSRFDKAVPPKLVDMAAIEKIAAGAVEPGLGQRIQKVIELLANNPVAIASIHLLDQLVDFPYLWQRLIEAVGTSVTEAEDIPPQGAAGSDIYNLQQHLLRSSNEKVGLSGDGSIVVLRASSVHDSLLMTSLLTQKRLTEFPDKSHAILAEKRGDLLDEMLEATNNPRLGYSALSPWRPIFQVLPLACDLLWKPLNTTALFQFLSHSLGPIPARHREQLARVVADVPGIGSAEWEKAIEHCLADEDGKSKERQLKNIRYWLESPRFSPTSGVDSATLTERAQRIANWLIEATEATENPTLKSLYYIAQNQTNEFVHAIERLKAHGLDTLTRDNVQRLIEDVRGTGAPVADRQAETCAGLPKALRAEHAGAFYDPVNSVVWWDCQATDHIHRWPWSKAERKALADNGVQLQTEDAQLKWLGKAWLRPILNTVEKCVIVLHSDVDRHHPVWDQISSLTEGLPVFSLGDDGVLSSLGISQSELEIQALPARARWWKLPENVELSPREFESYSSLDAYIHSPYQWLLRYAARIKAGSLAKVKDGNLLKGSLAHRLYEIFLNNHTDIQAIDISLIPDWVEKHARTLFQQEGANLLELGRQAECQQLIRILQDSLSFLIGQLQQAKIVSVQMELGQNGTFIGGNLTGSIDLLATRNDGKEAIIDIKWGGRTYRRKSLLSSNYLQLATYAHMRFGINPAHSPALSFFIVNDAQMLSLDHDWFPGAERIIPENQENWPQYWQRFEHTWRWRKEQFDQGLIEVTVSGTEPTDESKADEDGLEIPKTSDSFNDYSAITGWRTNG
ncbi:hypothetical protein A9Q83_04240 [Alphaproteobacteria bacterium 46_93_T64]|nr:hypothetical protein A9Q83_04240 [Alphaproteobacteria bacterium 46_93_T64]